MPIAYLPALDHISGALEWPPMWVKPVLWYDPSLGMLVPYPRALKCRIMQKRGKMGENGGLATARNFLGVHGAIVASEMGEQTVNIDFWPRPPTFWPQPEQ